MFKADISEKTWLKMGNRMLFVGQWSSVSLSAGEIGMEGNCIYIASELIRVSLTILWEVLDLSTGGEREERSSVEATDGGCEQCRVLPRKAKRGERLKERRTAKKLNLGFYWMEMEHVQKQDQLLAKVSFVPKKIVLHN